MAQKIMLDKEYAKIIGSAFEQGYALPPVYEKICTACGGQVHVLFDDTDDIVGYSCDDCGGSGHRLGKMIRPPVRF